MYKARTKVDFAEKGYSTPAAFYYRCPAQRRDRYVPTDDAGLRYLAASGICRPLASRIAKGDLSIAKAHQSIVTNRHALDDALAGQKLSPQQKKFLCNNYFRKHILDGRCSVEDALALADENMNLFYSLTLRRLFVCGYLDPTDLVKISPAGFKLLHDTRLVRLFIEGPLFKHQVLNLTDTQLKALSICYAWLMSKRLAVREALALTRTQIDLLRITGIADEVYFRRMTLSYALRLSTAKSDLSDQKSRVAWPSSCSRSSSSMYSSSMSTGSTSSCSSSSFGMSSFDSGIALRRTLQPGTDTVSGYPMVIAVLQDLPSTVDTSSWMCDNEPKIPSRTPITIGRMLATPLRKILDGDAVCPVDAIRLLRAYGELIHHLRVDDMIQFLDTSDDSSPSIFSEFNDGMRSAGGRELSSAYIQMVINGAGRLGSADCLRVLRPFLTNVFGLMVAEAFWLGCNEVISQCSVVWSLVRSRCAMTGDDLAEFRELAIPLLVEEEWPIATGNGLGEFGRLLFAMDLLDNDTVCEWWSSEWTVEEIAAFEEGEVPLDSDSFDAFLSPFEGFDGLAPVRDMFARRNESRYVQQPA